MLEYFAWLLAISLILILIFKVFRRRIPLSTRVLYGSVGISLFLGMVFPVTVANLTPGKAVAVFFGLIVFSAAVLSCTDNRTPSVSGVSAPRRPETPDEETPDAGTVESPPPVLIETPSPVSSEINEKEKTDAAFEEKTDEMDETDEIKEENRPVEEKTAAGPEATVSEAPPEPVTAGDCITAGFKARSAGDLTGAVKYFLKALGLCREPRVSAVLALEVSAVYQETGQYFQAGMILRSVAGQDKMLKQPVLRQKLLNRLVFLDTLDEQLRIAAMPGAPYSKIPGLVLIKANLEANKKIKAFTEGREEIEKQPSDFGPAGPQH